MSRAIVVPFHKYTNFGDIYYEPLLDYFLSSMRKYQDEYDMIYICDSNWKIDRTKLKGMKAEVLKTDPHLRYYDTYKAWLPEIKQDLVLFMDNDVVVYKEGVISNTFSKLDKFDIASICASIGQQNFPEIRNQSQFSLHWLATKKDLLMKYRDLHWGDKMPLHETFGEVTAQMIKDGVKHFEMEEDMSNFLFGKENEKKGKDLGRYHVRSGSVASWLLSARNCGYREKYLDYLATQPKSEYLRQLAWYWIMGGNRYIEHAIFEEMDISYAKWLCYVEEFRKFHGLNKV